MDNVLLAMLISIPVLGLSLILISDIIVRKMKIRRIEKISGSIQPQYYFEMFGAEVNPFTNRGLEKIIILEIKDKWVKYDKDGLVNSDKIEDLIDLMMRKKNLEKCRGWYLKDKLGNVILTV